MLIYKLSQNEHRGYDTFDSCVVIASTEDSAKELSIRILCKYDDEVWCSDPDKIKAELIGCSNLSEQLVLSSFNAG